MIMYMPWTFVGSDAFMLMYMAITLSPFKHCRVTLKVLPERQFRLNEMKWIGL